MTSGVVVAATKWCTGCRRHLQRTAFHRNTGRPDGLGVMCRPCHSAETGARQARLRRAAVSALGDRCGTCGFDDYRALVIDHPDGGGRAERRALRGPSTYYRHVAANPSDYALLCANCNTIKAVERGEHTGPGPRRVSC